MHKIFAVFFFTCILSLTFVNTILADDKTPEQLVDEARALVNSVSTDDVKRMIDAKKDVIFLDIRDSEEFKKSHLPGALHISRGLLEFMVADKIPDKNAKIVVY